VQAYFGRAGALNNPSYVIRRHLGLGNGQRVGASQERVEERRR